MADASLDDRLDLEEVSLSKRSRKNDRGRGRGGKSSGGRPGLGREVEISKALSKLLRHAAVEEGLELDGEGFANVDQVLKWRRLQSLKATFSDIQTAVTENSKQRFSMKPNPAITPLPDAAEDTDPSHYLIRANQGHSITIESAALLTPITLAAGNVPTTVVHGTYYAFYPTIVSSGGLKRMSRNHVHFSTGLPEDTKAAVISGMRSDAEILIYMDIQKSLEEGALRWWMSENGVVLTEGDENGLVPTRYWKLVKGRRQDVGVLWEDGVEVAELPQSVRGRKAPSGKGPKGRREGEKAKGKEGVRGSGERSMKEFKAVGGEEGLGIKQET